MRKRFSPALALAAITTSMIIAAQPALAVSPAAIKLYNHGIDAYSQGETDKALGFFQQAIDKDPDYADAYYNLGSIQYQLGNYNQAYDAFAKASDMNPADAQAKYNLGLTLEKLNRYDEAVHYFVQVPPSNDKYQKAQEKITHLKPYLKNPQTALAITSPTQTTTARSAASASAPIRTSVDTFAKGFFGPTGMTIGPGGFMYVANYSKNAIYKVGASGEKVLFAQGDQLQGPIGLTYDPETGDMYVANYQKNSVAKVTPDGQLSTLATGLKKPYDLFLDTTNHILYVSEQETNTISKIQLY